MCFTNSAVHACHYRVCVNNIYSPHKTSLTTALNLYKMFNLVIRVFWPHNKQLWNENLNMQCLDADTAESILNDTLEARYYNLILAIETLSHIATSFLSLKFEGKHITCHLIYMCKKYVYYFSKIKLYTADN
jgi:hypothetical protein